MELASFLAPSLKTMDSLLQVGRESFGLDPGCALDLHYRVVKVRLWGTATHFERVQFVYRHCVTSEERDGVRLQTTALSFVPSPQVEIVLLDEEFIVQAHGVMTIEPQQSVVSGLVLFTSSGRRFQVGAASNDSYESTKKPFAEIRELRGRLSPARDAFVNVSPVTMLQPNAEAIKIIVEEATEAAKTKWWYPDRCEQLAELLSQVCKDIQGVVARGIVYPVGVLCEFAEVAQLSKAVIVSCGQPLSVDYFTPRGLVIDGYVSRLAVLADTVKERIPKAELATLDVGDPVGPLDKLSVPQMIREALKSSHRAIAIRLCCKYPNHLASDEATVHRLVEVLIETEDCPAIIDVVENYAQASHKQVFMVMAKHKSRQPSLIERAIHREQPVLLEWLVSEARLDPFESPLTIESVGSEVGTLLKDKSATLNLERETQAKTLFEFVDCVQDKHAQLRMRSLLTHMKKKDDFQNGLLALVGQDQVSARQYHELVSHVTSVYDLPLLFSQAKNCLQRDEPGLAKLVKATCDHVVENRLVLDTRASAFFNIALRQASEHGYLSALDHEQYRILNSQINMETAAWVVDLKRTTDHMQWRVNKLDDQVESLQRNVRDLRESLRRNEEVELNRRRCRRNLALLSSMLAVVGGGQAVYVLQDMFDPVDPTLLISAGDEDFMDGVKGAAAGFLTGSESKSSLLGRFASATSFSADQPESEPDPFAGSNLTRGLGLDGNKMADIASVVTVAAELCNLKTAVQQKRVTVDEHKIRSHPYHHAVHASRGDLQQFKCLESALLASRADINDDFDVTVTTVHDDGVTTTKTSRMPAYIFASHLGFVDVVDYLLTNKQLKKREWKLTTKRRARRASSSGASGLVAGLRRLSTPTSSGG